MTRYVLRRLLTSVGVLLAGLTMMFVLIRVVPADPARLVLGIDADQQAVERFRHDMGLDRPLWEQYAIYVGQLLRGDLGVSLASRQPVGDDLLRYYPATLELAIVTGVALIAIGIPLGSIAGTTSSARIDGAVRFFALGTYSLPPFWLGLVLQVVFYGYLRALPAIGRIDADISPPAAITGLYLVDSLLGRDLNAFVSSAKHIVLPSVTLVLGQVGLLVRLLRVSILEVKRRPYVTTAQAKGLRNPAVFRRHVLRNALLPVLTMAGIQVGWLLTGTFIVESIFGWPGLGRYAVSSILQSDYAPVMGVAIVTMSVFLVVNLIVDILYAIVDPRIRYHA
jgi:peptide/nickel transport system permease protein